MATTFKIIAFLAMAGCITAALADEYHNVRVRPSKLQSATRAAIQATPEGRAVIEVKPTTDMPAGTVLNFARQEAGRAIDAGVTDDEASSYLAEIFSETFQTSPPSASWEAIVGGSFSAFVSRAPGRTFHAKVNHKTVIIYQTPR